MSNQHVFETFWKTLFEHFDTIERILTNVLNVLKCVNWGV